MAEAVSHIGRPRIQAVDLQEATRELARARHADRPGIRVAEYCLVITQKHLLLSAFAEGPGRKAAG